MKNKTSSGSERKKIAIFVTSVYMVRFFLSRHLVELSKKYSVTLILNNDAPEILSKMDLPVRILEIPIERNIAPLKDLHVFIKSYFLFLRENFDAVHTMTPKAGLIGTVSAFFARVPNRIHTFQGEVWANKTGFMRTMLRFLDRQIAALATHLLVVSHSEMKYLINEKIIPKSKSTVIAEGSIGGVNLKKFKTSVGMRQEQRRLMNSHENETIYLYVGRLNRDKGLLLLRDAFVSLFNSPLTPAIKLIIVGPDEEEIQKIYDATILPDVRQHIKFYPYTSTPEKFMNAADVFILPSYREGFGVVIIEAAAIGIPAIGSDIYGLKDAMIDGETGLFFQPGDAEDLRKKMKILEKNKPLKTELGLKGKKRVEEKFNQDIVINKFIEFYEKKIFNCQA